MTTERVSREALLAPAEGHHARTVRPLGSSEAAWHADVLEVEVR
ncbi:hypothetical protein [Streptomyces spirodelae]|nr:hypothetical protein [Streptomyces spirodelae]